MMIKLAKGLNLPLREIYTLASQGQTQARPFARVKQDAVELGFDPETLTPLPDNPSAKRKRKAHSQKLKKEIDELNEAFSLANKWANKKAPVKLTPKQLSEARTPEEKYRALLNSGLRFKIAKEGDEVVISIF